MRANIEAARQSDGGDRLLARYTEIGRALTGDRTLEEAGAVYENLLLTDVSRHPGQGQVQPAFPRNQLRDLEAALGVA